MVQTHHPANEAEDELNDGEEEQDLDGDATPVPNSFSCDEEMSNEDIFNKLKEMVVKFLQINPNSNQISKLQKCLTRFKPLCGYHSRFQKSEKLEDSKYNVFTTNNYQDETRSNFYRRVKIVNLLQFYYDMLPDNFNKSWFKIDKFIETSLNYNSNIPPFITIEGNDIVFTPETIAVLDIVKFNGFSD